MHPLARIGIWSLALAPSLAFAVQYPNPLNVGGLQITTFPQFLAVLLDMFFLLVTPIVIIMIIYSGFLFVTAQGDTRKVEQARKAFLWAMIGTGVLFGAKLIANILKDTVDQLR